VAQLPRPLCYMLYCLFHPDHPLKHKHKYGLNSGHGHSNTCTNFQSVFHGDAARPLRRKNDTAPALYKKNTSDTEPEPHYFPYYYRNRIKMYIFLKFCSINTIENESEPESEPKSRSRVKLCATATLNEPLLRVHLEYRPEEKNFAGDFFFFLTDYNYTCTAGINSPRNKNFNCPLK
jgi:hypothetical protein